MVNQSLPDTIVSAHNCLTINYSSACPTSIWTFNPMIKISLSTFLYVEKQQKLVISLLIPPEKLFLFVCFLFLFFPDYAEQPNLSSRYFSFKYLKKVNPPYPLSHANTYVPNIYRHAHTHTHIHKNHSFSKSL